MTTETEKTDTTVCSLAVMGAVALWALFVTSQISGVPVSDLSGWLVPACGAASVAVFYA